MSRSRCSRAHNAPCFSSRRRRAQAPDRLRDATSAPPQRVDRSLLALANLSFRKVSPPVFTAQEERTCGQRQQYTTRDKQRERDRPLQEDKIIAVRHDERLPQ